MLRILIAASLLVLACSLVDVINHAPDRPDAPTGPVAPAFDSTYACSARAVDPDNDSVSQRFAWGDGDTSDWSPLAPSGTWIVFSHSWPAGTWSVRTQARDARAALSDWSDPLQVAAEPLAPFPDSLITIYWPGTYFGQPVMSPDGEFIYAPSSQGLFRIPTSDMTRCDSIQTGRRGRASALSPDGTRLYVTLKYGGIHIFGTTDFRLIDSIDTGGRNIGSVIAVPGGEFLYATPLWADSALLVRLADNTVVDTLPFGPEAETEEWLTHHAFSPDGRHVYIPARNRFYVIDAADHSVVQTIDVGRYPWSVATGPDSTVYLSGDEQLYVLAGEPLTLIDSIPLPDIDDVGGLGALPGTDYVYAAGGDANAHVVDMRRRRVVARIWLEELGDHMGTYVFIHPNRRRVFIADADFAVIAVLGMRGEQ